MPFRGKICALLVFTFVAGCGEKGAPEASGAGSGRASQRETCASEDNYTPFSKGMSSSNQGLTVAIDSDPPVPTLGDESTWKLTITDSNGAPIAAGTKVTVKGLMTHSGFSHPSAPIGVKELGNGVYEASPVIFNMQGHWHFDFGIGTSDVPIELCVE